MGKECDAISVENACKVYRGAFFSPAAAPALDNVTVKCPAGEVVAVLGVNGSGKSTLLKAMLGLVRLTSGSVLVMGEPLPTGLRLGRIGYLPERFRPAVGWSVESVLRFRGQVAGLRGSALSSRIEQVLTQLRLQHLRRINAGSLSTGNLKKLGVAQAVLDQPDLLLLDEPTEGLDPIARFGLWKLLRELRAEGATIVMCSHQLAEVELLADRVVFLRAGRVALAGATADVMSGAPGVRADRMSNRALPGSLKAITKPDIRGSGVSTLDELFRGVYAGDADA